MTLHRAEKACDSACLTAEILGDNNTCPGMLHKMMQRGAFNSLYQKEELKKEVMRNLRYG